MLTDRQTTEYASAGFISEGKLTVIPVERTKSHGQVEPSPGSGNLVLTMGVVSLSVVETP